jgi:hypothetical protein
LHYALKNASQQGCKSEGDLVSLRNVEAQIMMQRSELINEKSQIYLQGQDLTFFETLSAESKYALIKRDTSTSSEFFRFPIKQLIESEG